MTHRTDPARARRLARLAATALLAAGLTACGSDDPASEPEPTAVTDAETTSGPPDYSGQTPASASPSEQEAEAVTATLVDFAVELDEDSFSAGSYEIEVVNDGSSTHDLVVERDGETVAAADAMDPGGTTTLTVTLEPGNYVFYCSIANHRAMGMEIPVEVTG